MKDKREWGLASHDEWNAIERTVRDAANRLKSGIFVEIGVDRAKTSACIASVIEECRQDFVIVGIDIRPVCIPQWHERLGRWIDAGKAMFFNCASQAVGQLLTAQVAAVFVDGCHCELCVTADIATWAPKIEHGGFMLFHDTKQHKRLPKKFAMHPRLWHDETRYNGVHEAIEKSIVSGWRLIESVKSTNGLRCYQRPQE